MQRGVEICNPSSPTFDGSLGLAVFAPMPNNSIISHVFTQIGLVEELGSGVCNLVKFTCIHSDGRPSLRDGLVFTVLVLTKPAAKVAVEFAVVGEGTRLGVADAAETLFRDNPEAIVSQVVRLSSESMCAMHLWFVQQVEVGSLTALSTARDYRYRRTNP